jgi:hypothetical protein
VTYFLAISFFLVPWLLVFWRRRDLRRELGWASALSVSGALPFEYFFWSRDWWHPTTITGTPVGVEDVLYAVGQGGLFAVLFSVLSRQRFAAKSHRPRLPLRVLPFSLATLIPMLLILGLSVHSAPATIVGQAVALGVLLTLRRDLATVAICSGALGLLLSLVFDVLLESLQPGFIQSSWYLDQLSGLRLLALPIEDVLWKLLAGATLGVAYKFWEGLRAGSRAIPGV